MKLGVYYKSRLTGEIEQTESGDMQFRYDRDWVNAEDGFSLSYSLPRREEVFTTEANFFFSNYLPEGPVRVAICRKHGISVDNDFALLRQIGGECAGALVISESYPEASKNRYEELQLDRIAELITRHEVYAALTGKQDMRLSLAGAQDKLPILLDGETLKLPLGDAASTHILKFSNVDYSDLVHNEYYTMKLAKNLGVPTPEVALFPVQDDNFLIVTRYDRLVGDESVDRLHQEDICQALSINPKKKYEKEGGPSFDQVYALITEASDSPLTDNKLVLQWQIANVFLGNCDGHPKNLSLLRTNDGQWRLAPFYDLVCTMVYPGLTKDLAMNIGGVGEIGNLISVHWKRFAKTLNVGWKVVESIYEQSFEIFPKALEKTHEELVAECGDLKTFRKLKELLGKNHHRLGKQWAR